MAVQIEVRSDSKQARQDLNKLEQSVGNIESSANDVSGAIRNIGTTVQIVGGLITAAFASNAITRAGDLYKTINGQLKLATKSTQAFAKAQADVNRIAIQTRGNISSIAGLYARFSRSATELGKAQSDVATAVQAVSESFAVSGSSAASADAAITQLLQGLASGQLRGEELNSVLEQSPRLASAIADELQVSVGALRGLAKDGKITSEVVFSALVNQAEAINQEFSQLPDTVSQAFNVLATGSNNFLAAIDRSLGLSDAVASRILAIGSALNTAAQDFDIIVGIARVKFTEFIYDVKAAFRAITDGAGSILDFIIPDSGFGPELERTLSSISDFKIEIDFTLLSESIDKVASFSQRVKDIFYDLYIYLVGNSVVPDTVDEIVAQFENLGLRAMAAINGFTEDAKGGFSSLQSSVTDITAEIADGIINSFEGIDAAEMARKIKESTQEAVRSLSPFSLSVTEDVALVTEIARATAEGVQQGLEQVSFGSFVDELKASASSVLDNEAPAAQPIQMETPLILEIDAALKTTGNIISNLAEIVNVLVDTISFFTEELSTLEIGGLIIALRTLSGGFNNFAAAVGAPGRGIATAITDRLQTPKVQSQVTGLTAQGTAADLLAGFDTGRVREYNAALASQAEIFGRAQKEGKKFTASLNAADAAVSRQIESLRKQANVSQSAVDELVAWNQGSQEYRSQTKLSTEARALQAVAADRARTSTARLGEAQQRLADIQERAQARAASIINFSKQAGATVGSGVGAAVGFDIGRDFITAIERDIGDLPGWAEAGITIATSFAGQIGGQAIGTALGTVIGTGIIAAISAASAVASIGAGILSAILLATAGITSLLVFPDVTLAAIEAVFGKGARDFVEGVREAFLDGVTIVANSIAEAFSPIISFFDNIFGGGGNNVIGAQSQQTRDSLVKALENLRGQDRQSDPVISKALTAVTNSSLTNKEVAGELNRLNTNNEGLRQTLNALAAVLNKTPTGFATGGRVRGAGSGTSDDIIAKLSNGEFVVNAEATRKYLPLLEALNNGQLPAFRNGGLAGEIKQVTGLSVDPANLQNLSSQTESAVKVALSSIKSLADKIKGLPEQDRASGEEAIASLVDAFKTRFPDIVTTTETGTSKKYDGGEPLDLKEVTRLVDSLLPISNAAEDFNDEFFMLQQAFQEGAIDLETLTAATKVLEDNALEAARAADGLAASDIAGAVANAFPDIAMQQQFAEQKRLLTEAERQGIISTDQLIEAIEELGLAAKKASNDGAAFGQQLAQNIQNDLSSGLSSVLKGESSVKDVLGGLLDNITGSIVDQFASSMTSKLTDGLDGVLSEVFSGNLFGGASAGGGVDWGGMLSSVSSFFGGFGGFFSEGGVVPGAGPVPIVAHGGEVILNKEQQNEVFGNGAGVDSSMSGGVSVNLQVVGDVSVETRKQIVSMMPEIADATQRTFTERRIIGG